MTGRTWSGRRVQGARTIVASWLPMKCGRCPNIVEVDDEWNVGHKKSRAAYPELMWVVDNWQPEHRRCSDGTGREAAIEKAARKLVRDGGVFPDGDGARSQAFPSSLSPAHGTLVATRSDLAWSPETMRAHPWLEEFAEVPDNASPPLWMSPPAEDAVCSYAWDGCTHGPAPALAWIEKAERKTLRWWQRLAISRQLEHRVDGSLCYDEVIESGTRRIGKSVRLRGLATWRLTFGAHLFGERQEIVHTGSDLAVCRKAQKEAWRWARAAGLKVTQGNGKEAIEDEEGGDTWLVRAQDAVYGWDCTLALVDESWDVKPDTVSEGLEPSLLERSSPQLHLTSTAHRRARSTMRTRLQTVLTVASATVLVLVWAAPADADPSDPLVWKAASAHWSEDRRKMIAAKYDKALAGEADPEADDPDPMAGFVSQYLNIWKLRQPTPRGESMTTEAVWDALVDEVPFAVPDGAAVETWFGNGLSVALAWQLEDGHTLVSVTDHDELSNALESVKAAGFRGAVTLGASLSKDPAVDKIRTRKGEGRTVTAVSDIERLIRDDVLRHDGQEHLRTQVLALRTLSGADGVRLASAERADAVKAAVWAVNAARTKGKGRQRLVLPSG